jgi:hypothetical protein
MTNTRSVPSALMRLGIVLLLTMPLAACVDPMAFEEIKSLFGGWFRAERVVIDTACETIQPVYWSVNDTDETIAQTKANNAVLLANCPNLRPAQ